jgi:hypothetical protein
VDELRSVTEPTLITIGGSGVAVAAGLGAVEAGAVGASSPVELEAPLGVPAAATPLAQAAKASANSAASDILNVLGISWLVPTG